MAHQLLMLLQLLVGICIFGPLIWLDRQLEKWSIKNPLVPYPRNMNELLSDGGKSFFEWLAANSDDADAIPRQGAKFVKLESLGGSEAEPDKAVLKARVTFSVGGGGGKEKTLPIFIKMPTARPYPIFFKALISTFIVPGDETKEIQFYKQTLPMLRDLARSRGFDEAFRTPKHIAAAWCRPFERAILVSRLIDSSLWHCRPDRLPADDHPQIVETMLSSIAHLHALTFDCTSQQSRQQQPKNASRLYKFVMDHYSGEVENPAKFIDNICAMYLPSQPQSVQRIWKAVQQRCARFPAVLGHGDFRQGNMLFDNDTKSVTVTDWELQPLCLPLWDVSYCIFSALTPGKRRETERHYLSFYAEELVKNLKHNGRPDPASEYSFLAANGEGRQQLMDMHRLCMVQLHFFSWGITMMGGVGKETQGNSEHDLRAWTTNLTEVCRDYLLLEPRLAEIIGCEQSLVEEFRNDVDVKKIALQAPKK